MQRAHRAVEQALAVGEHQQPLAVALGLLDVVSGEDHRRAAAGEPEHELPQALALARVEPGAGLVQEQDGGASKQPDRNVDPLLVSSRQRPDLVVAALGQRRLAEHLLHRGVDVRHALEVREQAQVLGHGEAPIQRRLLRDPPDLARLARNRASSGRRIPASIESSVVLPAPLGPITASSSPRCASKLTPRSATRSPKRLTRPRPRSSPRAPPPAGRTRLQRSPSPAERYLEWCLTGAGYAAPMRVLFIGDVVGKPAAPASRGRCRSCASATPRPSDRERRELRGGLGITEKTAEEIFGVRRRRDHDRQPRVQAPRRVRVPGPRRAGDPARELPDPGRGHTVVEAGEGGSG